MSYKEALKFLNLETLEFRRNKLSLKFALKTEKHEKFKSWFNPIFKNVETRSSNKKYYDVKANTTRFQKSPLSFLTRILNLYYLNKK